MKRLIATACWILISANGLVALGQVSDLDLTKVSRGEQRIRAALTDDTRMEFIETPLDDVCGFLRDLHNIPIWIDTRALENDGIAGDIPITANVKGITLQSALSLILKELELTWLIQDQSLVVTTEVAAKQNPTRRVYFVGDLIALNSNAEPLAEVLEEAFEVEDEEEGSDNAGVRVLAYQQFLIVRGTEKDHYHLQHLLAEMRAAIRGPQYPPTTVQHHRSESRPTPVVDSSSKKEKPKTSSKSSAKEDPFAGKGSGDPFGGGSGSPFAKPEKPTDKKQAEGDPFGP